MFSIRIHHGGKFRRYPGRMYVSGRVNIFDMVDIDLFTVVALNMMVFKLGYTGKSEHMFYSHLRPFTSLDEGCMLWLARRMFVIDDAMRQLSFDETELDGEAGFAYVARSSVDSSGLSHDESFGVDDLDLNLNEPVNLYVSQEPIVVEVSTEGNGQKDESAPTDEGIDTTYETEYDVQSSEDASTDDDDDVDEDFMVDEKNEIVELDVDVHLFGTSMDLSFDNIGVTNLVPDEWTTNTQDRTRNQIIRKVIDIQNLDGMIVPTTICNEMAKDFDVKNTNPWKN
nr:hypothetical protein [Tanacetum cinerariifolium]